MIQKSRHEALLSIINKFKTSKLLFKNLYKIHKDKFDKIEQNMEDYERDLEHMNKSLNMLKWLLFISKTKEDFFENIDLLITRPDGSPVQFTEEQKEKLFENSKAFQMFILLLELSRIKYQNINYDSIDWSELKQMQNIQAEHDIQTILNMFVEQENKENQETYHIDSNNQTGGMSNINNRNNRNNRNNINNINNINNN